MMTFSDGDPASAVIKIQAKPSSRSSTSKHSPWSKLDEQRLLVYKNGLDPWYSAESNLSPQVDKQQLKLCVTCPSVSGSGVQGE
jgi:hypothetical protein